jgi:hypothetical protein
MLPSGKTGLRRGDLRREGEGREKSRPQPESAAADEDRQLEELSEAFKWKKMEEDCFAPGDCIPSNSKIMEESPQRAQRTQRGCSAVIFCGCSGGHRPPLHHLRELLRLHVAGKSRWDSAIHLGCGGR